MKAAVFGLDGKKSGEMDTGRAFSAPVRKDLIVRAVLAERAEKRQAYGADPMAGKRTSAHYHGLRSYRWTMMNKEMARMKRIHNQGYLNYTARFVPQATKGREAHPPKAEKIWTQKINKKEWIKAFFSAAAATSDKTLVILRGHKLDGIQALPIIVDDHIESVKKTNDLFEILKNIGLVEELGRSAQTKTRAGRGKMRGRRIVKKKGPIIVVGEDRGVLKIANVAGVDVVKLSDLDVSAIAPGANPGRLCIWSRSAVEGLKKSAG